MGSPLWQRISSVHGSKRWQNSKRARAAKKETRALVVVVAAVFVPLMLVYFLVAADIRPDLAELEPRQPMVDSATLLVSWGELEDPPQPSALRQQPRWAIRPHVRMLGYMMDGVQPFREHALVDTFLLLPDAGHVLHPAHHIPDQMIEVHADSRVPFTYRSLAWVSGTLTHRPVKPQTSEAAFLITDAQVAAAPDTDIMRFFLP